MSASEPTPRPTAAARRFAGLLLAPVLLAGSPLAFAQYAFDTSRDGHAETGTRYFGSARDDRGTRLSDVIFLLDSPQATFSFVTDACGRFAGVAPLELPPGALTARCMKPGFRQVRLSQRPGPKSGRRSMQIDCVLRAASAS